MRSVRFGSAVRSAAMARKLGSAPSSGKALAVSKCAASRDPRSEGVAGPVSPDASISEVPILEASETISTTGWPACSLIPALISSSETWRVSVSSWSGTVEHLTPPGAPLCRRAPCAMIGQRHGAQRAVPAANRRALSRARGSRTLASRAIPSRLRRLIGGNMFTRIVHLTLKTNAAPEFAKVLEHDIVPKLRDESGFQDEL